MGRTGAPPFRPGLRVTADKSVVAPRDGRTRCPAAARMTYQMFLRTPVSRGRPVAGLQRPGVVASPVKPGCEAQNHHGVAALSIGGRDSPLTPRPCPARSGGLPPPA